MSLEAVLKDFKVIKPYKATGQKRVLLAEHSGYGKAIIKIGRSASKADLDRAKREVEVQKSLDSHYYPKIFDFISFADFQFVIIEEFIDSQSLSSCHESFSEPLLILNLLKSLVSGLDLLWQARITHRDLKPDNILIRPDNSPVIIDLGIVLAIDKTDITSPFAFFSPCTPNYAAPEQLKNRRAEIDPRTDQFVLGIDVMELIGGGIHPFDPAYHGYQGSIPENIIKGIWNRELLNNDKFYIFKNLINRLLAQEPYKRFRNSKNIIQEIENCIEAYK
ncbi:MAG TPA: protein kinase [Desulfatiglandales bacterium]|nr:protein kinase [Desulfatiglandales bacterium]